MLKNYIMEIFLIIIQLLIVLTCIFIGARVGGIGLGIYGMVGVFLLVFGFGLAPGTLPIDVMLIIVSVITAAASLQAAGGLDYLVGLAAKFLRKHPSRITYYGPFTTWLFCLVAGTAHTSYSQLPFLFAVALFVMSIMLFSQAATVATMYPIGIALGISAPLLLAMFPAVNGYFFLPNYPTEVAAINFDRTGTTRVGRYVVNHSFQVAGFVTTVVSIGVGYLITLFIFSQ